MLREISRVVGKSSENVFEVGFMRDEKGVKDILRRPTLGFKTFQRMYRGE